MKLEVAVVPVSDVDSAKAFYDARQGGKNPEEAATEAERYMNEVLHIPPL